MATPETDEDRIRTILPLVYDELRRLARHYIRRERANHTLGPTALVHEAYLRLAEQTSTLWKNRGHFYSIAAQAMRRVLVNHAVHRRRIKRGGGREAVEFDEQQVMCLDDSVDLISVDEALQSLAEVDEQKARVVEMKFFGSLTNEETAEALGVSVTTVKREWRLARIWLLKQLNAGERT